jgi:septal ring-binding cell division protein DamX
MLNKFSLLILFLVIGSSLTSASGSEVSTLFTTPQERQLIDTNRYKLDEVRPQVQTQDEPASIQPLEQEEVRESITISGITLSNSGPNMVWINSKVYEDGDSMDEKMRIKVMPGKQVKVRITAPDGKHYFATSGETVEIVYQAAVEN